MAVDARDLNYARSFLFVPADKPEMIAKAYGLGADAIVLDLEDAVAPGQKAAARQAVHEALRAIPAISTPTLVRVNAPSTPEHTADYRMLLRTPSVKAVVLPKATASEVRRMPPSLPVIALLETAEGLLEAAAIASAANVLGIGLGAADLAAELGCELASSSLLAARSGMVLASAAARKRPPIDTAFMSIRDRQRLVAEAHHARSLGFTGKFCIHPAQLTDVHAAFTPSEEETQWARDVISAFRFAGEEGVIQLAGQVIDAPVVRRAQRLLAMAGDPCTDPTSRPSPRKEYGNAETGGKQI